MEMNNFGRYITPEQAKKWGDANNDKRPLSMWREVAQQKGQCTNCDEPIWKYGETGMCFTCTTGEADASDDIELLP
jgi:hypothetical protein